MYEILSDVHSALCAQGLVIVRLVVVYQNVHICRCRMRLHVLVCHAGVLLLLCARVEAAWRSRGQLCTDKNMLETMRMTHGPV